jgi:hypothetical protein
MFTTSKNLYLILKHSHETLATYREHRCIRSRQMESSQPSADGEPAFGHGAVRTHRAARHRQLEEFRCRALTNIACSTCWIRALGWGRSSAGHRIWPQGSGRCARPCGREQRLAMPQGTARLARPRSRRPAATDAARPP